MVVISRKKTMTFLVVRVTTHYSVKGKLLGKAPKQLHVTRHLRVISKNAVMTREEYEPRYHDAYKTQTIKCRAPYHTEGLRIAHG